jgi:thioesterase domain-containing protein
MGNGGVARRLDSANLDVARLLLVDDVARMSSASATKRRWSSSMMDSSWRSPGKERGGVRCAREIRRHSHGSKNREGWRRPPW